MTRTLTAEDQVVQLVLARAGARPTLAQLAAAAGMPAHAVQRSLQRLSWTAR